MDFRRYVWGWETLISRYRVCSELAGSQSERVLTLAAHSVLSRRPLSRGPFRPLCLLPFRPCSLARSIAKPPFPRMLPLPAAQTTLPVALHSLSLSLSPPPTTSAPGESSDGAFPPLNSLPSRPSDLFLLFCLFFSVSSTSPLFWEGTSRVVAVAGNIGRA